MASFSKIRFLRHYSDAKKLFRQLSTKQNLVPHIEEQNNKIDKVKKEIQDKIIYSSIIDQENLHLNYKAKKIIEDNLRKAAIKERLKKVNEKPLPVSLKLAGINIGEENAKDSVKQSEHDENYNDGDIDRIIDRLDRIDFKEHSKNWMQDYEFFDEDEEQSPNGTPDPSVPPSKVPCSGCGALLQCADSGLQGYIPSEIFRNRTNEELKRIVCQRCHFLQTYNIALDVNVTPEMYIEVLSTIKDKYALAVLIVDLLDFPCSIWPGIQELLGNKRPIFVVGNKVDLLPKDSQGYLNHIKNCLTEAVVKSGLSKLNIKHVSLISAKTGYGIEELITQLHNIWHYKGDVYLVGCTNVGKSSLFNALLRSDYCKVEASDLVKRATTCIWPGTTLKMLKFPILRPSDIRVFERCKRLISEREKKQAEEKLRKDQLKKTGNIEYATLIGHIGQTFKVPEEKFDSFGMSKGVNPILTLDERSKFYIQSKWCYDTPGVIYSDQIHHLLTTEELLKLIPREMITPRVLRIKSQMSLFLGGLARFDFISGDVDALRIAVYSSHMLPILVTKLEDAIEVYKKLLGSELLCIPIGDEERLSKFPKLEPSECIEISGEECNKATCDITLSSAGWLGLNIPLGNTCKFQVWTPEKRGIHIRKPSLIPFGENLRGKKIRGSLAYRLGKPFIT